jgi:23S rRNA (guanosine2251-2'-O)-methyltransferase
MQKKIMEELARSSKDEFKNSTKTPLIIVLDNVRSMNNVGSVFRTSDAFAIQEILLCGYTPTPPHRDIEKTALGATETVAWQHFESAQAAMQYLQTIDFEIYAIEQVHNSISLEKFEINKNKKYALILGIEIPQGGSKHSLNISVTAGIVAWQFYNNLCL